MSAERSGTELVVSLRSHAGEEVRVEWDEGALQRLGRDGRAPGDLWHLAGPLDWDEVEALRVLSARTEDGRILAIAALRPRDSGGHDREAVAGAMVAEDRVEDLAEVLFSTEYSGDEVRRVGLELYRDDDGMPLRAGADARAAESEVLEGVRRERIGLRVRFAGASGVGLLEVLRRA